ncbi:MAG TPA: tetratricopeptide repeat protein [Planctomycetota bacterium]|nr:tetratricopeptide repeat protein [Planctomycetota bacterium]
MFWKTLDLLGILLLVSAVGALSGCQTTTTEKGGSYMLTDSKSSSILDSRLKKLKEGVKKYPLVADYHYKIAGVHYEKAEYNESAAALERAIGIAPDNAKYHYQLARVFLTVANVAEAEEHFRAAVRLSPPSRYTGPHAALGWTLAKKKDWSGALEQFRKCTEIDPENPVFYYYIGACHDAKDEQDPTIHHLREYLARGGKQYREKALMVLRSRGVRVDDLPAEGKVPAISEDLFGPEHEGDASVPGVTAPENAPDTAKG